ncbi:MAG: hypothetical protein ACYC6B_00665 [Thermoleophilia bacterium]
MTPIDLRELTPPHQEEHALRLMQLKESVTKQQYEVGATQIAGSLIREALSYAAWRQRHPDR